jgi:dihydropteroate synthase
LNKLRRRPLFDFYARDTRLVLGKQTRLAGILNVTPDSFSDGGRFFDLNRAVSRARAMQKEGADWIDLGGESSRPGARAVSAREEIRRVLPVLKKLKKYIRIPISVDTTKAEVAEAVLAEGADMINDITALRGGKKLARSIARSGASVILMHMQGNPRSMQKKPVYRNVVREVRDYLAYAAKGALEAGIPKNKILIDPGFGFGKTPEHNLQLLGHLDEFHRIGLPIFVGLSRKSFIGTLTGAPVSKRLSGSLGTAALAVMGGAHVLRVHDVAAHKQLITVLDASATRAA